MVDENVFENEIEDDDYSNDDLYNISSWGADLSFRELIFMYEDKELLKPELQRKYVWDKTEASRFIESLLMGLPVPSIFLAKTEDECKLIVDGYQRIMTVYDYVQRGIFSKDEKSFKLSNSKAINERWRGKTFNELEPEEKRRIKNTTIHAIIFEQKTPKNDTGMYQIFERINTSGRTLTPQEIRNCIYQGSFNDLLFELNNHDSWRKLYGSTTTDPRMQDLELILRFFALGDDYIKNSKATQISLKKYLNEYMGKFKKMDDSEVDRKRHKFINTMDYIYENFGENAFHNIGVNRFHNTTFDAISIATAYIMDKGSTSTGIDFIEKKLKLFSNEDFKTFITERTTNISHINGRISLALEYLYGSCYE